MLLPTFIGAAGLLATAVEAAPRGTWFPKLGREDQGSQGSKARMAARSDSQGSNYANAYSLPDLHTPGVKYASPDTYTKANSQYAAPKNTSTSTANSKTLKPDIECPTGGVYVSTTTLDMTVTVTASSNMSYTICRDCTQTVTRNGTVYLPGGKYVPTLSYDKETNAAYPVPETTNGGGQYSNGSPYHPINATYLPPKTKDAEDPDETESCTDDYPYMNSTIAAPLYTTPVDRHVSASGYPSAIYNTPSGYKSDVPVYTRPAYVKPVYPEPGHSNSSIETPAYTGPVYTKPVYPRPSGSGNSTVVAPVYTRPSYPHPSGNSSIVPPVYTKPSYPDPSGNSSTPPAYIKPVYTKPVYPEPNNSSVAPTVYTPPVYTKPSYTKPVIPGNSSATPPIYTKPADPSVYTPPAYTKAVYPETPVPGNSSTVSADPTVYTPPVYTKPVYPHPVTPGNSSTGEAPVYTPSASTKPIYSDPVVPGNSSTVPAVITTPVDPSVYTPPAYTKPVYSEPLIPGNSSTSQDAIYTPPVNTKPAYPGSVISSSSHTNEAPVYTPPVNTRQAYPDPVASGNSSMTPPVYTKPVETPIYSESATTKSVETPVYSPPVYTKPVFPSESSDGYPLPSPPSNSTIPPVIPVSSSDSSSAVNPTFTPEASTSQGSSVSVSTTFDPASASIEPTTLPVTPFLTTSTSIESSTTEPCIIDTSMVPISSSYLNATATTSSAPTETICEDDAENGAPNSDTAYCGVKGEATGMNFLAEFSQDSYGMPVTLEGCYQFCKLDLPSTRGCEAYRFYHNSSGAPRCAVYGLPVYRDIREIDSTVEDVWYDLSCGSPSNWQDDTKTDNQSSGTGASLKLGLGLNY
ncbi:hypothetical protein N0V84_010808 [Fusarium piperis]|uniref:Apple domain-containing protein n=1 Tax=Fusarium piperis TaxID=1435070 RepID=A0A9W8TES1_9HYPO|nr:hypothetical protein N0V84_010808 [Fusarium piperis]